MISSSKVNFHSNDHKGELTHSLCRLDHHQADTRTLIMGTGKPFPFTTVFEGPRQQSLAEESSIRIMEGKHHVLYLGFKAVARKMRVGRACVIQNHLEMPRKSAYPYMRTVICFYP